MKIGILGSRGIPNNYGGFEQFAEYISKELVLLGYDVTVYSSHNHSYQNNYWNGVEIIHKYNPEKKIGVLGQFIYDLFCVFSTRKKKFDVILQLGYTSSSIWGKLLPQSSIVVTNMDGLEWKRSKYNLYVKFFLRWAEKLAINTSDYLIADSVCIQEYLLKKYNKPITYLPYGATPVMSFNKLLLKQYNLIPNEYFIIIARIEPENNIDLILSGFTEIKDKNKKILVIGDVGRNKYGRFLKKKYSAYQNIIFTGGVYDIKFLNVLRHYSAIYFHGHSVGGTNPSLLEAMASKVFIAAHDNQFNKAVVGDNAAFFSTQKDVREIINNISDYSKESCIQNNFKKIREYYNWNRIVKVYDDFFKTIT